MITLPLCRAVLSATAAVVLAAGAAAATPSAAAARSLALTNGDANRSVTVQAGDEITVRLVGRQTADATWVWSEPVAADPILRRASTGTGPNGDATAVFLVEAGGTTKLASQMRCVPRTPGTACPYTVVPWQVTVTAQ